MTTWKIDPMHSEVQFKVKHLMISTVTGHFKEFDAEVQTADDTNFEKAEITFSAKIDSITTGNEQRDTHLKSVDFFDSENYPKLSFKSNSMSSVGDGQYVLKGDLTLKDVTKQIELNADFGGRMVDFYNQQKAGFDISGKINRKDFGLNWSAVTEAGGVVVSDEVKLIFNIQLTKQ